MTEARNFNAFGTNFEGSPEPIYGTQFLPRKFKIGVTVPGDNSIDVLTNDLAIVIMSNEAGEVQGYDLLVGGGMGRAHRSVLVHLPKVLDLLYASCTWPAWPAADLTAAFSEHRSAASGHRQGRP